MSVKTISVEQIASPILLTDASMRVIGDTNALFRMPFESANSSARLTKNKSYSFLVSRHLSNRRQQLTNSSTDSMIHRNYSVTPTNSSSSTSSTSGGHFGAGLVSTETFTGSAWRRNFIKSRLSQIIFLVIYYWSSLFWGLL